MGEQKYWPYLEKFGELKGSIDLEARAGIALRLIESYGAVAGKPGEEDKSGRARLDLQTPQELVERCFAIADLFIDEAERRGEIRSVQEAAAKRDARIEAARG